jgi:hypothetical protein
MMAKKQKPDMPPEVWLRVATDALSRYAAGGGKLAILEATNENDQPELVIHLEGLTIEDPRLAPAFALIYRVPVVE